MAACKVPLRDAGRQESLKGAHTPYQAFLDDVAAMTTPAASDNLEAIEKTEVKPEAWPKNRRTSGDSPVLVSSRIHLSE